MRPASESIQDQDVEIEKPRAARLWNLVRVGTIRDIPNSEPQDFETGAMLQTNRHDLCVQRLERLGWMDPMHRQSGRRSGVSRRDVTERIIKRALDSFRNVLFAVQGNGVAKVELKEAQIVEAKDMVGVFVGKQDCVDDANIFAQQLSPKVRRRVYQ